MSEMQRPRDEVFPIWEEVEDHAGRMRMFEISCLDMELGFRVQAEEVGKDGLGYEFVSFSETNPYSALGDLRGKMRSRMATRHLTGKPGAYQMLHDVLQGRLAWDGGRDEVVMVVDGEIVDIENLARILQTHESWNIEIRITEPTD